MAVLQSTNVVGTLCVNGVAVGGGKDFKYCCISGSGNFTPPSGLVDGNGAARIVIAGGGGGGGGSRVQTGMVNPPNSGHFNYRGMAPGGGGGGVLDGTVILTSTADCCTIIGAGGTGGCSTASIPNEGGTSCFGSILKVAGGGKGDTSCYQSYIISGQCRFTCGSGGEKASLNGSVQIICNFGIPYGGGSFKPSLSEQGSDPQVRQYGTQDLSTLSGMATLDSSSFLDGTRYGFYESTDGGINPQRTSLPQAGGNPGIDIDFVTAGTGGNSIALGTTTTQRYCVFVNNTNPSDLQDCTISGSNSGYTPPAHFYGTGGSADASIDACYQANQISGNCTQTWGFKGGDGSDGIAIIKWSE
jgi:hypothetical protein